MRRYALVLALLMPMAIDGALFAEVLPKVLIAEESSKDKTFINYLDRLDKEANAARHAGLFKKAIIVSEEALTIRQQKLGEEHIDTAGTLFDLGVLYADQGLFSKAEPLLLKALAINEKALDPEHPDIASVLNNLGLLYTDQGLFSKAEPFYLRALAIYEKALDPEHPDIATVLNNIGLLYTDQGLFSKAEPFYFRALAIYEKALDPEHPDIAPVLNNLGLLYADQGLFSKAEPLLLKALAINEKALGPEHPNITTPLNNLASIYTRLGLFNKAEPLLLRALKSKLIFTQREIQFLPLSERRSFFESMNFPYFYFNLAVREKQGIELAMFSRLNTHGFLEDIEKRQAKVQAFTSSQKEIIKEILTITQQLASKNLNEKQRTLLNKQKDLLEKTLYSQLPELKPQIIEIEQVVNAIPPDAVLVEYQRFEPFDATKPEDERWEEARYLAMSLKPNGDIQTIDLGLAEPIETKINQALSASEQALEDAQQLWEEVGALVIKPLTEAIGDAEILFISPDAELNRIPFAALSSHKGDQLLIDAVKLRLLTTGRELVNLAKTSKATKQKPLVLANPAFNLLQTFPPKQSSDLIASNTPQQRSGDLTSFNWSPLPGTIKEGKAIAKLTKAKLLTKNKATALAVQEQKQAPKILHIASHAYFLPDQDKGENPLLRSGIVLAGANEPNANPKDDGYLTALEVTKLDWNGTELVVISGCESGKGDIQSGEGVYGLKRAIAVAGARSSLLSLWKVDDAATAAFMKSFYQLLKKGESRADALAATQKEFKSRPGAWSHPYFWAAFQLSGDWRAIEF